MKIVLATPLFPPDLGGPATYAKLLMDHLPGAGDEVVLVKFSDVRHLPKLVRHIAYFQNVFKAAQTSDLLLALDPVSVGLPVLISSRILRKPLVVKVVGDFAWEQGRQRFGITDSLDEFVKKSFVPLPVEFFRTIQTFVAKSADAVIVPSNYLKTIITAWGVPEKKISVIYNSIELPVLPEHVLPKPHTILSVGRLVPWKGMSELIDAVEIVQKKIPDVSLVLAGDGPERKILEEKGERLLGKAITFTGAISHTAILEAMQSAEVFVLNSSYEGLSHTVIEALMLGSGIVVSDAGGNPELVTDGVQGRVVPVGDTSGLADAIVTLLENTSLRSTFSSHAKESAQKFSVPTMIAQTRALLTRIATHP